MCVHVVKHIHFKFLHTANLAEISKEKRKSFKKEQHIQCARKMFNVVTIFT